MSEIYGHGPYKKNIEIAFVNNLWLDNDLRRSLAPPTCPLSQAIDWQFAQETTAAERTDAHEIAKAQEARGSQQTGAHRLVRAQQATRTISIKQTARRQAGASHRKGSKFIGAHGRASASQAKGSENKGARQGADVSMSMPSLLQTSQFGRKAALSHKGQIKLLGRESKRYACHVLQACRHGHRELGVKRARTSNG